MTFQMVVMLAALVAGPVIRNASAAPGDTPPSSTSTAAIGTEAVAQTYTGTPSSIIARIAQIPPPRYGAKYFGGRIAVSSAATTSPISSARPMSLGSAPNP